MRDEASTVPPGPDSRGVAPPWRIHYFDSLPSTQTYLLQQATTWPEGTVIVARQQTAGHGRQNREWYSAPGGLFFSLLLKPAQFQPRLPEMLLSALVASLTEHTGLHFAIKWPNDVLLDGQKVAGLLIDSRTTGSRPDYAICGIGINVSQTDFPPPLAQVATSLQLKTGRDWDRASILAHFLQTFAADYSQMPRPQPADPVSQTAKEMLPT